MACRDLLNQIEPGHLVRGFELLDELVEWSVEIGCDEATCGAVRSNLSRDRPCVDARDSGDLVLLEELEKRRFRSLVKVHGEISNDESGDVRFVALAYQLFDSVVSDMGRCHHHDLKAVRRIGRDLLVPD